MPEYILIENNDERDDFEDAAWCKSYEFDLQQAMLEHPDRGHAPGEPLDWSRRKGRLVWKSTRARLTRVPSFDSNKGALYEFPTLGEVMALPQPARRRAEQKRNLVLSWDGEVVWLPDRSILQAAPDEASRARYCLGKSDDGTSLDMARSVTLRTAKRVTREELPKRWQLALDRWKEEPMEQKASDTGKAGVAGVLRPSMTPQERAMAIRWTGIQHSIALVAWVAYGVYRDIGWEVIGSGMAVILGLLQAPAIFGKGPAGTLSVPAIAFAGWKAIAAKTPFMGLMTVLLMACSGQQRQETLEQLQDEAVKAAVPVLLQAASGPIQEADAQCVVTPPDVLEGLMPASDERPRVSVTCAVPLR
jgi:hypothetical protein